MAGRTAAPSLLASSPLNAGRGTGRARSSILAVSSNSVRSPEINVRTEDLVWLGIGHLRILLISGATGICEHDRPRVERAGGSVGVNCSLGVATLGFDARQQ